MYLIYIYILYYIIYDIIHSIYNIDCNYIIHAYDRSLRQCDTELGGLPELEMRFCDFAL
jgi:hypothetical protein